MSTTTFAIGDITILMLRLAVWLDLRRVPLVISEGETPGVGGLFVFSIGPEGVGTPLSRSPLLTDYLLPYRHDLVPRTQSSRR